MSMESGLNGHNHTSHMVQKYVGTDFEHVKHVSENLELIKQLIGDYQNTSANKSTPHLSAMHGNSVFEVGVPKQLNFGVTRSLDAANGVFTPTGACFNWSNGNTFSAINGVFRVKIRLAVKNVANGLINGLLLRAALSGSGATLVESDYIIYDSSTKIQEATLSLETILVGNVDGTNSAVESCIIGFDILGDMGATIEVVPFASSIIVERIGNAPVNYIDLGGV